VKDLRRASLHASLAASALPADHQRLLVGTARLGQGERARKCILQQKTAARLAGRVSADPFFFSALCACVCVLYFLRRAHTSKLTPFKTFFLVRFFFLCQCILCIALPRACTLLGTRVLLLGTRVLFLWCSAHPEAAA
jgi:hypothetical protein